MLDLFSDSFKQEIKEKGYDFFTPQNWMQVSLVRILILVNCGLFFFVYFFEHQNTLANWKLGSLHNVFISLEHEWFRFVTAIFLHGDVVHLLLNMLSLLVVGTFIERLFSRYQFLIIYIVGGVLSTITSYYFTLSEIDSIYHRESLGASGAILSLLGALTIYLIINKPKLNLKIRRSLLNNLSFILILNLGLGLLMNQLGISLIDNAAHIGGFLSGGLIAFVIKPKSLYPQRNERLDILFSVGLLILTTACFAWMIFIYVTQHMNVENWIHYF